MGQWDRPSCERFAPLLLTPHIKPSHYALRLSRAQASHRVRLQVPTLNSLMVAVHCMYSLSTELLILLIMQGVKFVLTLKV